MMKNVVIPRIAFSGFSALVATVLLCTFTAPSAYAAATTPPEGATLTDLTNPNGTVTTTTSGDWVKPAKNAFDNGTKHNNDDRSVHSGSSVDWIYTFDEPTKVNAYKVYAPGTGPYNYDKRMPRTWTFEAKNAADATWTTLDTQPDETGWQALENRYYEFRNYTAYDSYRFAVTANQADGDSYIQIDELEFFFVNRGKPELGTVSLVRTGAATYSLEATEDMNAADLSYVLDDGETVSTNGTQSVAESGSAIWTISGLAANTTYRVSVLATNAIGMVEVEAGTFHTGELTLGATTDANEAGLVSGGVLVSRGSAAPFPITVNYTISGSAGSEGSTWASPVPVTIPAGFASVTLPVVPLVDPGVKEDIEISVSLAAGNYEMPAVASASLTLANVGVPSGFNVWVATADGLASVGSNWSEGHRPTTSENVLFDGRFSIANCEWDSDASATVASWTQTNGYTGVVTLDTVYPGKGDFQCLTVTGAMAIACGTITHPQSRIQWQSASDCLQDLIENETYRVCINAGSLTVGASGRIDVRNKGYYHANSGSYTSPLPAHGGRLSVSGEAPYDDVKEPIHVGMPHKPASGTYTVGIGGGAIYITSDGAIIVDGYIGADTGSDIWNRDYTLRGGAAAGSVYVRGASVAGTGTISASAMKTDEQNNRGVGGRVAVIATSATPIDYATLQLKASVYPFNNNGGQSTTYGGCGTVYVKDGTMTNGVLIVRNFDLTYVDGNPDRRTDVTAECDWTFDRLELGGGVQLSVSCGTTLTLPGWDCVTASANSTGTGAPSGLICRGGTLDFGSASDVSLDGHWYFAPISNYVFNANVSLVNGAMIGFGGKYPQQIANNAHPDKLDKIHCTVNGDLTVPDGCAINVNLAGAMQDSNGVPADYPLGAHGGRRSNTMKTIGSVFHPKTLPHGQSNSYGHIIPGGAVELAVSGTLTLGGTITSTGYTGGDGINSQVGGGSIDISAGRLVGAGTIKAGAVKNGQPGGRIAIHLTGAGATLGDFEGTINCATMGNGGIGSCGSIYVQTAADGEGRGTIIFDDNNVTCTTYTPICATGYEADDVVDFKRANLIVRNQAKAQVSVADANGIFKMGGVEIDETGGLDLFGKTFVVRSARIAGSTVPPGTYTAAQLEEMGLAEVVDTADGAGGSLVVSGGGFSVVVR